MDRRVAVAAVLSTGELLHAPALRDTEKTRLLRLQRRLGRARRGSNRRAKVKAAIARLKVDVDLDEVPQDRPTSKFALAAHQA